MNEGEETKAVPRKPGFLRRVAGWLDVFRSINKVYYEVSVEDLAAEVQRVAPAKKATPPGGEPPTPGSGTGG